MYNLDLAIRSTVWENLALQSPDSEVFTSRFLLQCKYRKKKVNYLYNFGPLMSFYIVKLGFTEVYITFLISAQKT